MKFATSSNIYDSVGQAYDQWTRTGQRKDQGTGTFRVKMRTLVQLELQYDVNTKTIVRNLLPLRHQSHVIIHASQWLVTFLQVGPRRTRSNRIENTKKTNKTKTSKQTKKHLNESCRFSESQSHFEIMKFSIGSLSLLLLANYSQAFMPKQEVFRPAMDLQANRKPFIAGNWKLNPETKAEAVQLATDIAASVSKGSFADVSLFVPFPFIEAVQNAVGDKVSIGAEVRRHEHVSAAC